MHTYECYYIAGTGVGAIPIIGGVLSQNATHKNHHQGLVVRDEQKDHGTRSLVEGPLPAKGTRVVLVDDVLASGKSIIHATSVIEDLEAEIVAACVIVDRSNEDTFWSLHVQGIGLHTITNISQLRYINGRKTSSTNR